MSVANMETWQINRLKTFAKKEKVIFFKKNDNAVILNGSVFVSYKKALSFLELFNHSYSAEQAIALFEKKKLSGLSAAICVWKAFADIPVGAYGDNKERGDDYKNQSISWAKLKISEYLPDAFNSDSNEYLLAFYETVDVVIGMKYQDGVHAANDRGEDVIFEYTDGVLLAESLGFDFGDVTDDGDSCPIIDALESIGQSRINWLEVNTIDNRIIEQFL